MKEKENLHAGHRQRLKERFSNGEISTFPPHEVLELLLTYCIPRKDTNYLAHKLIKEFGSLSAVLDAGKEQLLKVSGVGKETALFLSLLPDVFELYKKGKENFFGKINSIEKCVKYFRANFEVKNKEYMYIICLNSQGKVNKTITIQGEDDNNIKTDVRELTEKISSANTHAVIMFHTHPKGACNPSMQDLEATQTVMYICGLLGIVFCDHLIFNESEHLSLYCSGYLDKMFVSVGNSLPGKVAKPLRFSQPNEFHFKDVKE